MSDTIAKFLGAELNESERKLAIAVEALKEITNLVDCYTANPGEPPTAWEVAEKALTELGEKP